MDERWRCEGSLKVAGDGRYTSSVHVAPAEFVRHDKANGRRYDRSVGVTFKDVPITTERE